jgi:formylglycine-generating enzyme required for sulfatase activity
VTPKAQTLKPAAFNLSGWPFDGNEAERKQKSIGVPSSRSFDLGNGVKLDLVLVPAGTFVMGDPEGQADEHPLAAVKIEKPYWMGRVEISNEQYSRFDSKHDSRFVDKQAKDHFTPGYPANAPEQPVIRVTWEQAMAFCGWLSQKTGQRFTLPTEAQWEWAARAGTATPFWYGGVDTDFSRFANLADRQVKGFEARFQGKMFNYIPNVEYVDDGEMITAKVGKYRPNPWGLFDMYGNVAEWTLSTYRAYPYNSRDGRDDRQTPGPKVVRGGSWRDMPSRARSASRLAYEPYQPVFDVGFRVVMEAEPNMLAGR